MRKYFVLIALLIVLTACGAEPYAVANPYAGADLSQSTAAAAWSTAAAYGQQITATQRAEVLAQQSAALQATQAAAQLAATQTAESIHTTQSAQATIAAATQRAAATQQALQVAQTTQALQATAARLAYDQQLQQLELERRRATNTIAAMLPWAFLVMALALAAWAIARLVHVELLRRSVIDGRLIVRQDGRTIVVDPDRMPGPQWTINAVSTETPADYQPEVTARAQQIQLAKVIVRQSRPAAMDPSEPAAPPPVITAPALLHTSLPAVAPWTLLDHWDRAGLPLGVGQHGLITIDPERQPHLLIAGTTGSGKSRGGLRPLVAAALAAGWQTVILDRSGLDFQPFMDAPNARLVLLRDRPEMAARILAAAYAEILRRQHAMFGLLADSWSRMPADAGPRVMIVLDEFSNLADSLSARDRDELWRQARMVAAEGRKAGIHLVLALQNPTYNTIDLRIRRNMSPVCYQVMDATASRVVLNTAGAEGLHPGQFLTLLDRSLAAGVSFNPTDNELADLIGSQPPALLPAPVWVEDADTAITEDNPAVDDQIRIYLSEGLSLNEVQRRVFGFTGGSFYARVKRVAETISTTTPSMPSTVPAAR